jgi:hypothetical protein
VIDLPIGIEEAADRPERRSESLARAIGPWIGLWMLIQGLLWITGFKTTALSVAIETGAAEVERRAVGEIGEDETREAISDQRKTIRFWTALALVRDFVIGPAGLLLRAMLAAVLFAALGAMRGITTGFGDGLQATAKAQGFWVVGMAVQAALMIVLRRGDIETSAVVALPPGTYPAALWLSLRELEPFALAGWFVMARGAWVRGQSSLAAALLVVGVLWAVEASIRISAALVLGAWTRQTLIPDV